MVKHILRHFWFSGGITLIAIIGTIFGLGWGAAGLIIALIIIEVAFSFENAVINAKVLERLNKRWQTIFLTVGILIAVIGMRLVFPVILVSITASLGWLEVIRIALNEPDTYAHYVEEAYPSIAAFGGGFLMMLALYYFLDKSRDIFWFKHEKHLSRAGHWWMPPVIAVIVLAIVAALPANQHAAETIQAGLIGVATYIGIQGIIHLTGRLVKTEGTKHLSGWPALATFMYLELLDASFSLDGVIGAFAITTDVVLIAIGLGVGAFWVRSFTLFMVRRKTLDSYIYLEHGAHYAVTFLAFAMLLSLMFHLPEAVTGGVTLSIIAASFWSSIRHKKNHIGEPA